MTVRVREAVSGRGVCEVRGVGGLWAPWGRGDCVSAVSPPWYSNAGESFGASPTTPFVETGKEHVAELPGGGRMKVMLYAVDGNFNAFILIIIS